MSNDANRVDALVVAAKGTLGAIPLVGPILAEVVGSIIPNQRIDRISRLVEALRRKVADLDQTLVEQRVKTPEGVDLLEDAFHQAARALSDERLEYIAGVLKTGITDEEAKQSKSKFLMWLLGQLSDPEIILLAWLSRVTFGERAQEFEEKHQHIIEPPTVQLDYNQEKIEDAALYMARKAHLVHLGLLRFRYRRPRRGKPPQFDEKTGMMEAVGHEVTTLGRLLLRTIDPQ